MTTGNTLSKKLARRLEQIKAAKKEQPKEPVTFKKEIDEHGEQWGVATMPVNW